MVFDFCFLEQNYKNMPQQEKNAWISNETKELSKLIKEIVVINKCINNTSYNEKFVTLHRLYWQKIKSKKKLKMITDNDDSVEKY